MEKWIERWARITQDKQSSDSRDMEKWLIISSYWRLKLTLLKLMEISMTNLMMYIIWISKYEDISIDIMLIFFIEFNYRCDHNTQVLVWDPSSDYPSSLLELSDYPST